MTNLTEAMKHLREEINTWRHARVTLRNDLLRQTDTRRAEVSALCSEYREDRAGALRAWSGLTPSKRAAVKAPAKPVMSESPTRVEVAAPAKPAASEPKPAVSHEPKAPAAPGRVRPSPAAMTTHAQKSPSKARRAR